MFQAKFDQPFIIGGAEIGTEFKPNRNFKFFHAAVVVNQLQNLRHIMQLFFRRKTSDIRTTDIDRHIIGHFGGNAETGQIIARRVGGGDLGGTGDGQTERVINLPRCF